VKIKNNLYIKIGQTTKIWTCDFFVFFEAIFQPWWVSMHWVNQLPTTASIHVLSWQRKVYSDWEDVTSSGRALVIGLKALNS